MSKQEIDRKLKMGQVLVCPNCDVAIILKIGINGFFYGCSNWNKNRCLESFSCFQDTLQPFKQTKEQKYKKFNWSELSDFEKKEFFVQV